MTTGTTPYLTIGQVADIYGVADWQARRAVDALEVQIPRAGLYRLVPRALLGKIAQELDRRGWLSEPTGATTA
jgi:hypothetical protein